jgi:SAM-dependent methyltransferase
MLTISEPEIRASGPGHPVAVLLNQWVAERRLAGRGIRFRDTDSPRVAAAYAAMTPAEFDAVNGRQDWANWRTIPRALSGNVPDGPLLVLDLGCGTGGSTRVLAHYCPAGSHLIGYELAAPLVAIACRRDYRHRTGRPVRVDFVCQGVTERLRLPGGAPVPAGSVDLVNASGVVGHHLDKHSIRPLQRELRRVLTDEGVAMLDVGPTLPGDVLRRLLAAAGFEYRGHFKSWLGDRTGEMVFRRTMPARRRRRAVVRTTDAISP